MNAIDLTCEQDIVLIFNSKTYSLPSHLLVYFKTIKTQMDDSRDMNWKISPLEIPHYKNGVYELMDIIVTFTQLCFDNENKSEDDNVNINWKNEFFKANEKKILSLYDAADYFELELMVEGIEDYISNIIKISTIEQIRAFFNQPDDLTREEKRQNAEKIKCYTFCK